ncbi:unnamed protein product [Caretta caretta]
MSAESPEPASAEEQKEMEDKVISPEKVEEAKLKARYPHLGQKPGGSDFLRKRLQKGQKYFDSGDYNMAKAKMKNKQLPTAAPDKTEVTVIETDSFADPIDQNICANDPICSFAEKIMLRNAGISIGKLLNT